MRLIDSDELIEVAHRIRLDSREWIERMIESAPTVDAVEVVRCKDCVGCDRDNGSPWCGLVGLHVDDDHYCAWGEKR